MAGRRTPVAGPAAALAAGVLACALVAGCTAADPERESPNPSPSDSAASSTTSAPVTLRFAVYGPPGALASYDQVAAGFTAENPHVTVEVEDLSTAEGVLDAVADPAGAPDVFLIDQEHLPGLVEDALVQPVDGLLAERQVDFGDGYQRSGLTAFAASAALQCMPQDVSPVVVYYNKDLVDLTSLGTEDDPPPSALDGWDWETFARAARLASRGPADGVHIEPSVVSLAPFVWSVGGEIVDDVEAPTTLTLAEGDSREALEQVLALVRDPRVTPARAELETRGAVRRFATGDLGMVLGTRALTPRLRRSGVDFDVMPLPSLGRFRTVADMTGYCVAAETDVVETAGDFVAYAVGSEGAAITARAGYVVPSNLEIANSATFYQPALPPESSFIFNEGVRRTQPMPFVREWPELTAAIVPTLERMFYDPVIDLDLLLEDIDATSKAILAPEDPSEEN